MLEIQKFIRNQSSIETANSMLEDELSLRITKSTLAFPNGEEETVYIYNYHQYKTPYESTIGREARGLILNLLGNVVSFSFKRFPNYKQDPEEDAKFHWDSAYLEEKLDGTLIIIYSYREHHFIQTRGRTDASGEIAGTGVSYHDAVRGYLNNANLNPSYYTDSGPLSCFYGNMCYAFEYIGPGNRHVTPYNTTMLVLLSIFNRNTLAEMSKNFVDNYAMRHHFPRPIVLSLTDLYDTVGENLNYHMNKLAVLDEGYVIVDNDKKRLKIKSESHLEMSQALNIGDGVRPNHFASIVLKGEHGEIKVYFPEYGGVLDLMLGTLEDLRSECRDLWEASKDIELRKDFALAVSECPLKHVLFKARNIQEREIGSPENIFDNIEDEISDQNLVKLTRERKAEEFRKVIKDILDIEEE